MSGAIRVLPIHPLDQKGIVARVSLLEGGQRHQICERAAPNREWSSITQDLSPWVGRWVEIELEAETTGPLAHPVALGWANLQLEVSTGGKPEPTADLLGLAAWGYSFLREQKREESIPVLPRIGVVEWEEEGSRVPTPVLRMDLPTRERPYSLIFRVPVWIPDAVLGSTVRLTPYRSEVLWKEKITKQRDNLRWAVAVEETILHLGRKNGSLMMGWGLPGVAGIWITLSKDGSLLRVPAAFVDVERTPRGLRATYQCVSPAARGVQGSISVASKGKDTARLVLETSSQPEDAVLHSLDLLGWFHHSGRGDLRIMTDTEGGRIWSPADPAPWAVLPAERDLPLLAAFCEDETLVMDWPSDQSLVLGPLGPFHLADAGFRALQTRQSAFRLTCPSGRGRLNLALKDGAGDWLSACRLCESVALDRWGNRSSKWLRPHVFHVPGTEESFLDPLLEMKEGLQACPRPVLVPLLPEADLRSTSKRAREWIQADWAGTKSMHWSFKRFLSRQILGSDTPFVQGNRSDIWIGSCWSVSNENTIPFVDLVAGSSWVLLSHPGDTWSEPFGPSFSSNLALSRPSTLLSLEHPKLDRATSNRPFLPGVARCGGIPRPCILTHPSVFGKDRACWTIHLTVPTQPCRLKGYTGIADEAVDGDGVVFVLSAEEKLFLARHHKDREWQEFYMDLSAWNGMSLDLRFTVSSGPHRDPVGDWALWGDLSLESPAGDELVDLVSEAHRAVPCEDETDSTTSFLQGDRDGLLRRRILASKMLHWSRKELSGRDLTRWIPLDGGGAVAEYGDGMRVFVVGERVPHLRVARGILPRGGFFFEGDRGELGMVTEWDGRTYGQGTLFWVYSLDRGSLGQSKHVRLVRVAGEPLIRLRSYRSPRRVVDGTLMASGEGWYEVHVPEKAEVWLQ